MQRNKGKQQNGKTRDLFKNVRDTKGTFHTKMGLIKDRNGMDLTEAEDIKKRRQEYTEELYKKDLHKIGRASCRERVCPKNYGARFVILYRRQQTEPSQRKRNARRQSGYLRRLYK